MKKRLLLCLIASLLLPLTVPAYAVSIRGGNKTVITAEPYLPDITIEVVVPTSGNVYINPNRLPVKVDGNIVNKQIVSDSFHIENLSEVPLKVSVEVEGRIKRGSDMGLLIESAANVTTTSKKAFIFLDIQAVANPSSVTWAGAYDANKHVIVRDGSTAKKNIITLDSADQEKRFGAFRLAGDCVQNPRSPWTEKDGVDVEVVFTFSPLPVGTTIP